MTTTTTKATMTANEVLADLHHAADHLDDYQARRAALKAAVIWLAERCGGREPELQEIYTILIKCDIEVTAAPKSVIMDDDTFSGLIRAVSALYRRYDKLTR